MAPPPQNLWPRVFGAVDLTSVSDHTIRPVLYLHETHRIAGDRADDFEAAWREHAEAIASQDDMRVLWFMHHAHGTGPSYTVVTVTGLRDGGAWERLARAFEGGGPPGRWARAVDAMRHDHVAKLLAPVGWSALQEVDLTTIGASAGHDQTVYMEDTVSPFAGKLDAYIEAAGTLYARNTIGKRMAEGTSLLELRGAFRTLVGTNAGREVILWQRVVRPQLLERLLTREVGPEHRGPGTWMHDALAYRDRWESRLLRTAAWSPLD